MMQQISIYLTSIILGIMLFFSFVVAPVTFTALDEENARKFIRKIFPYYYTVNLAISVLILILFIILKIFSLDFYLILSVALLFAVSNFPKHKKIMEKVISIGAKRHKKFEIEVRAKKHHKLNLDNYIANLSDKKDNDDDVISQIKKLDELFKSGVINEKEFKKAREKVLK